MSTIAVDTITDEAGTGAPDFPNGFSAAGPFTSLGIDDNATSTAITVDSAGKLGVGTASPTEKLDVAGTVKATSFSGDGSSLTGISDPIKAWVNFNGTGAVAIRASYNVSSITDNGTGDYTINFTTALTDANYSAVGGIASFETNTETVRVVSGGQLSGSFRLKASAGAYVADSSFVQLSIIR